MQLTAKARALCNAEMLLDPVLLTEGCGYSVSTCFRENSFAEWTANKNSNNALPFMLRSYIIGEVECSHFHLRKSLARGP